MGRLQILKDQSILVVMKKKLPSQSELPLPNQFGNGRKKNNIKGPEIISKENGNLSIEERLANILPMEIPKAYEKIREMDEIERYTESLFQGNWTTTQPLK